MITSHPLAWVSVLSKGYRSQGVGTRLNSIDTQSCLHDNYWSGLINARAPACPQGLLYSLFVYVCVCVCLSVCYHFSANVRCVCDKLNLPAKSLLNAKGF